MSRVSGLLPSAVEMLVVKVDQRRRSRRRTPPHGSVGSAAPATALETAPPAEPAEPPGVTGSRPAADAATAHVPPGDHPDTRSDLDRLLDDDRGDDRDDGRRGRDDSRGGRGGRGGRDDAVDDEARRRLGRRIATAVVGLLLLALIVVILVLESRGPESVADGGVSAARSDVPEPPAGAPAVGTYVETRVTGDGDVVVRQWIRSASPLFGVLISIPPLPGGAGGLTATDVVVSADEAVLNQPDTVGTRGKRVFFAAPPELVLVRYTLRDVVEESPSVPGRAFVRLTAVRVAHSPRTGPTRVAVVGDVLSLACVATPLAAPRPCGAPGEGRWTVLLKGAARGNVVTAQLNTS